ncbi:50S ribosomal protein L15 [Candidatus Parcubacteria bacterium]|nr:50S ribosomal protein L15 [Candidatus Parcubacteria bacterium]
MQLHTLKARTKRKVSKQVGRGGTRCKTSGRGTKGQNARAGRKKRPEIRDFIKRFPKLRGRGVSSFKSFQAKAVAVNVGALDKAYASGEKVTVATLLAKKVIPAKAGAQIVKILGSGELSKKLSFEGVLVSLSAKAKIEKAGGSIAK